MMSIKPVKEQESNVQLNAVAWKPEFSGPVEGFVVNWIRKNHWQVSQQLPESDDVKQEAYCVFLKVVSKYPDVDNPRWFMTMFMNSFKNRMTDCSRKQIRHKAHFSDMSDQVVSYTGGSGLALNDGSELSLTDLLEGDLENEGITERLMEEAQGEVAEVLRTLFNMPNEVFAMLENAWTSRGKRKVMGNNMLCAMLGKDATKVDLVKKVEEHFLN